MYDRSVWLEEVDIGLVSLITSTVKYKDLEDKLTPVDVSFPLDLTDLKNITLPNVIIRHLGETFDMDRYDPNNTSVVVGYNESKTIAYVEEMAKPYNLKYQLDFISEYKEDMNLMLKLWHAQIGKRHNLLVNASDGSKIHCYMHLVKPPNTMNQQQGDIKMYRTVFLYDIKVELDMGVTREQNIAVGVNLDINM